MKISLVIYDLKNEKEVDEIFEIICIHFKDSPWHPNRETIKFGAISYYRALDGKTQIGITGFIQKTPALAETVKTLVFPEMRGKGYGAALSQAIEDECRKKGMKKVMSTIFHFNHTMINIKLKQGYTIEGYHSDHEAPGFHEYSLGKRLV